jgi:hypothetical protein
MANTVVPAVPAKTAGLPAVEFAMTLRDFTA